MVLRIKYIFLAFLIIGCSVKHPQIGQKAFPKEDNYIIKALVLENERDYKDALKIYKFLYKKTDKNIYYAKYIEMLFNLGKYDEVIKEADKFLAKKWDDEVFKYKIFALLQKNELQKAKKELLIKFNKKNEFFYSMMSYILMKEKHFEEALFYSRSNYALNPNINNLLNLSNNLVKLKKYNEAIAYLQTYLKEYGCNYEVCLKLAEIYKSLYDIDNLAKIYEKLGIYNDKFYVLALNLYMQEGEYKKALNLVKKYNLDEEYLMYIYKQMGDFKNAALIAMHLYIKTKDIKYLIKYTIFCYEGCRDKKTVLDIVSKLKYILTKVKSPYLYNFLGYILIDNNINPKEGIEYIKKALEVYPDKEEYIDSLAWGFYKLHDCKSAWEIIKNIESDDKTILLHKKLIKRCLNDIRKNNKSNKKRFRKKKK